MTEHEVNQLDNGLYRVWWRDGGLSVAAVGRNSAGDVWLHPTNWISGPTFIWNTVASVDLLTTQRSEELRAEL